MIKFEVAVLNHPILKIEITLVQKWTFFAIGLVLVHHVKSTLEI